LSIDVRVKAKLQVRIDRARIERVARRTLRLESVQAALTIYLTDDVEIRKMNRAFHGTNAATDVLAFPLDGDEHQSKSPYMGDIVISYDRARQQAHSAGWSIADELDLLVVHGILHLIGYDDHAPKRRTDMWKRQEQILGHAIKG
jgi:probable rRNA maturation factor